MAVVRISRGLRWDIIDNIENLYRPRIQNKLKELETLPIAEEVFFKYVPKDEFQIAVELNKKNRWVDSVGSFPVVIHFTDNEGKPRTHTTSVKLKNPMPAPKNIFDGFNKFIVDDSLSCHKECERILREADQMTKERDSLKDSIAKILDNCSTLQQLVKVWPTALDFVPEQVKSRYFAETDKKKKKSNQVEIDDETKVLLTKARMLSGV